MGLASSILWIVAGIIYIIYQGLKADAASTIVILGVAIAIPAGGLVIYGIDKLLKLIHPLFACAFWCTAIIVGYLLYLKWWYREKRKRDADLEESRRRRMEELQKYENREFSEEEINKMIGKFLDKGGRDKLEVKLRRAPTDEEIRDAAIDSAVSEFIRLHEAAERCLQSIR